MELKLQMTLFDETFSHKEFYKYNSDDFRPRHNQAYVNVLKPSSSMKITDETKNLGKVSLLKTAQGCLHHLLLINSSFVMLLLYLYLGLLPISLPSWNG